MLVLLTSRLFLILKAGYVIIRTVNLISDGVIELLINDFDQRIKSIGMAKEANSITFICTKECSRS